MALIVLVLGSGSVYSQALNLAKIDSLLNSVEQSKKFMGGIAIAQNGHVVYSKNIGYADIENNYKAHINTKYRIGSITKTFTAVLVLKAVDEKKIKLDQTLEKYFPMVPNANKITIRSLLNHRSGIHNFSKDESYFKYRFIGKSESEMVDIIIKAGSDFTPDSKAMYSNSNYVLLSYILEKIYQKTYAEILKENIVQPLGLLNTYFGGKIETQNNESYSYDWAEYWQKLPETNLNIFSGAGAIVSTPTDVLKFTEAVFNGKVISKSSLKAMKETRDEYGLGLGENKFEGSISYGHTGHIDGFNSMYGYFPKDNISFIITSNGTSINNNDIAVGILSILFNVPYTIPKKFD
ncbi:serine hydrolase domain-containing protein [Adhaeribacter aquaticus]|uniref:serine hydrolase domain-containing protein n=1 Tax=Adhaeribacter aquaticus TaxID=299567 RepID=UPI00146FB7E6|nr:serine hydrolase domain-containing protein [Adhaeribacter aquaticus]